MIAVADLARAREIEHRILFRRAGLAAGGLFAPWAGGGGGPDLLEFIAMHIAQARQEGREQGALEAHRLWQSGALPVAP